MKTTNQLKHAPTCQHCSEMMSYEKVTDKNMLLQLVGVLLFFGGIFAMVYGGPLGIVVGLVMMIIAARLGYRKKLGWKCRNCGYFFEAARK